MPFETSVSRDEGTPDCLFREEVQELEEFLEDVADGPAKERGVLLMSSGSGAIIPTVASLADGASPCARRRRGGHDETPN